MVIAVKLEPAGPEIEGDHAYTDLAHLPRRADAIVIEVPREETREWVAQAADAGIHDVWIHMGTETPEALELAEDEGLDARSGHCAVMYVSQGFSYHSLHKWAVKLARKY